MKAVDDYFEREVNHAVQNDQEESSSDEESSEISAPKNHKQEMRVVEEEVKNDARSPVQEGEESE